MTREEAIVLFEKQLTAAQVVLDSGFGSNPGENDSLYRRRKEMAEIALTALRPVSREQVEKMRGEWIIEDVGNGDRRKKCSLCNQPISGWWGRDRFCANCGSPMTDEAVDMVMERWKEAVVDEA